VSNCGAAAGSVLGGARLSNRGLRLRVLQEQAQGEEGPLQGRFVVLDVGDNLCSPFLQPLLGGETDAAEVRGLLPQEHAGFVNIAHTGNLVLVEC
jgi:hypothetical protein